MKSGNKVFISYSNYDIKWVYKLTEEFKKRQIEYWLDKEQRSESIVKAIEKGLNDCNIIVFVISSYFHESEWTINEYEITVVLKNQRKEKKIIPLLIDDVDIPIFLKNYRYIDFRNENNFKQNLEELIDIIGQAEDYDDSDLTLSQLMLKAEKSLTIWGHTLNKFTEKKSVKNALFTLFEKDIAVTLILTNPYSNHEKIHEQFPHGGGDGHLAREEIFRTINFMKNVFDAFGEPKNFKVILSNYVPEFRTIFIDNKLCYIRLYMYGKDVSDVPMLKFGENDIGNPYRMFLSIQKSLEEIVTSKHILYLINDGIINENWDNSRVFGILTNCLEKGCCKSETKCWEEAKKIILGYQNKDEELETIGLINKDYEPGTFTINNISRDAKFLEIPKDFDQWITEAINDEVSLIKQYYKNVYTQSNFQDIVPKVRDTLKRNLGGTTPLKNEIWYQEYPDIIRRLILSIAIGNPDYELNIYPNLTTDRKEFIFSVVNNLDREELDLKQWLHLSVAAGLLGINEKHVHAATSSIDTSMAIKLPPANDFSTSDIVEVSKNLINVAQSTCRIDSTCRFFHTLNMNRNYKYSITSFPDDYLETIILLKYYEKLLNEYPKLEIYCIPRSIRCGNDATYQDIQGFLSKLPNLKNNSRFHLLSSGPVIGGVNIRKLSREALETIRKSNLVDVRGARNYEMMQGINKEIFFGFIVCREISESVTGLSAEKLPFVYIRHPPKARSFSGFMERHLRVVNGKTIALTAVIDKKTKWEGGYIAKYDLWTKERKNAFKVNCSFYSSRAEDFHLKYGRILETEVVNMLNHFSGRVLCLGCGSGKEVEYLCNRGCKAEGIDFSYEAIKLAQKDHYELKNSFKVEDIYNLDNMIEGTFDGIVANATLVHLLDKQDIEAILQDIYKKLKDNGLCFIRVLDKKGKDCEMDNNQMGEWRWFVYYKKEEVVEIAKKCGFKLEEVCEHPHARGYIDVNWVSVLLKKE